MAKRVGVTDLAGSKRKKEAELDKELAKANKADPTFGKPGGPKPGTTAYEIQKENLRKKRRRKKKDEWNTPIGEM